MGWLRVATPRFRRSSTTKAISERPCRGDWMAFLVAILSLTHCQKYSSWSEDGLRGPLEWKNPSKDYFDIEAVRPRE